MAPLNKTRDDITDFEIGDLFVLDNNPTVAYVVKDVDYEIKTIWAAKFQSKEMCGLIYWRDTSVTLIAKSAQAGGLTVGQVSELLQKVSIEISTRIAHNLQPAADERPPLGLRPRHTAEFDRAAEILEAMQRYVADHKPIPREWIHELTDRVGAAEVPDMSWANPVEKPTGYDMKAHLEAVRSI